MQRHSPSFVRAIVRWVWVPVVAFVLVVAVAMGCAVWSPVQKRPTQFGLGQFSEGEVPVVLRRYEVDLYSSVFVWTGIGVSYYDVDNFSQMVGAIEQPEHNDELAVGRAGFPFRCLRSVYLIRGGAQQSSAWARGIDVNYSSGVWDIPRTVPLMPEPVGMVLNVLIVSALIVIGRAAVRHEVRYHRKTKDRCMECGYPIEWQVDHCPECGGLYPGAIEAGRNHA